jgi:hypothetical protein
MHTHLSHYQWCEARGCTVLYIIRFSLRSIISEDEHHWLYRKKSTQIFAYADVAIVSKNKNALKDTLINIESEARRRGLLINENKTKYMEVTRTVVNGEHLCCGKHEFEHVKEFSYLGLQMNQTNSISSEIQARIISGNCCYYALGKLMKSRALNRSSKLKIYKSLIRPLVTYGCKAWTLTNQDEQNLRIFE